MPYIVRQRPDCRGSLNAPSAVTTRDGTVNTYTVLISLLLLGALSVVFLPGCSLYHHPYSVTRSVVTSADFDFRIIQVDDFGSLWDRGVANNVLNEVEVDAARTNTIVVVFVHGWHHNAHDTDDNLRDFKKSMLGLVATLGTSNRRNTREELTGSPNVKVVGIYVGWRGRSLPGLLDYGTVWWRKAAAERVGDGDAAEFLERLQRIYLRANSYSAYERHNAQTPGFTPYMGLVTIGHSFGGQVVLNAVGRALEGALIERAPCETDAVNHPSIPSSATPELVPIDSFGDLNILLNPALEAYQFARIDELYRQLTYPVTQSPQLVVFSADNDTARSIYFPIARALTSPFRPKFRNSFQGALWGQALGDLKSQQTHELTISHYSDSLTDEDFLPARRPLIADYDFTAPTQFSSVKLSPLASAARIANSPVAVVVTHDKLIDGHNGIFLEPFDDFLEEYIAFIEAKRTLGHYAALRAPVIAASSPLQALCSPHP
jgi:pimeloyl-ACP methyl ester carboxylesterase